MEAIVKKQVEITIKLNEAEARWLKGYTQNFMLAGMQETVEGAKHREDLFNLLKGELR